MSFGNDRVTTAALGVNEQDLTALGREFASELKGFFKLHNRLFEVDDVNLVAGAENVLTHLRIPEASLVTEVATGFEHFAHANHDNFFLLRFHSDNAPLFCGPIICSDNCGQMAKQPLDDALRY